MQGQDTPPPRMLLLLFGTMGTGILLPWNTFISGADYFEELYPCAHIEFKFAIAYMASLMIFMLLCVVMGHFFSLGSRVVVGYVLLLLSMLGSLPVNTQAAHVAMVVLTGIGDALVQGSMYGVAGSFPPLFMRALMMGTAVAGVIVSAIRIFSKVCPARSPAFPALLRRLCCVFLIDHHSLYHNQANALPSTYSSVCPPSLSSCASSPGFCSGFSVHAADCLQPCRRRCSSLVRNRRHPYGQVYLSNCGSEDERRRSPSTSPLQMKSCDGHAAADPAAADSLPSEGMGYEPGNAAATVDDDQSGMLLHRRNEASGGTDDSDGGNSSLPVKQRLRLIMQLLRGPLLSSAVAVAGNFGITLALFPGVLTEMRSSNRSLDDWYLSPQTTYAAVAVTSLGFRV